MHLTLAAYIDLAANISVLREDAWRPYPITGGGVEDAAAAGVAAAAAASGEANSASLAADLAPVGPPTYRPLAVLETVEKQ